MSKHQKNDSAPFLNEPIAIVGMGCQFPGIDSDVEELHAFFKMLEQGLSPIKEIPKNRWDIKEYYDPDREKADKIIARKGGFLVDPSLFDAAFFKIASVEAKHIDPQHRLFLEVSIRALNHANIRLDSLANTDTAVFCGTSSQDYSQLNYKDQIEFNAYTQIGAASSAGAGRLSHFLNLKGPSVAVDTACSSSLSALYLAVMALRAKQSSLAIVGGVHLNLCPENFIGLTKANMLSARDQCASFDSQADGFVRSEGCGVIIVKRLSDALRDKDRIHALIKSIVMNQDGDEGTAIVAPNLNSQIAMHEQALAQANLLASDIDYVEAHGTGTVMGDSVEFNALAAIHQGQHSEAKPLIIGALKSNLGHGIASSGIASLIKAVCALHHETIPPNLHYSKPGSTIEPERIPARFPVNPEPFGKLENKRRYVQVANFGFTGTKVTAVIEEPPASLAEQVVSEEGLYCFVVSANSLSSLKQMLVNYRAYLQHTPATLRDICYTLIHCRDHFKYRLAILAKDKNELLKKIDSKEYALKKVVVAETMSHLPDEPGQIYEAYLSGATLCLEDDRAFFNKVELPSYAFDRKSYWHEPRTKSSQEQEQIKPASLTRQPVVKILNNEPIAIIGMACRLPKAKNIAEFLTLLEQGKSGMVDIPLDRWDNEKYYDADLDAIGRLYIKQLGLINDVKNFDADFFNVSPREAKMMSPQLRIFLETSYHALEDANLPLDNIKDSNTGVFVGCGSNEYPRLLLYQGLGLESLNIYFATGNVFNAVPGRVAYTFDFHGPIQAIDTACSSSMTAIHNACLSLQSGDCDMALAGGVNTLLTPDSNVTLSKARMLSPESRCKTFSEDADGYARSEGCGVVILKRLSTAIEDGDTIAAVIKGSAINSDGKSGGFTVPNGLAQEDVIRAALAKSQLSAADIDFIEAHGTGTPLADPIEVQTLTNIFSAYHSEENPLYLGSVKTNIGHCESASGVAGVLKTVLSLQTKKLFKHLNFKTLNPEIELKNTVIPLATMAWKSEKKLRYAGVSSFGFSGANAHLILQEVPHAQIPARQLPEESLLVLSAKNQNSLELLLASYQQYLARTEEEFADICYTAATCRSHFLCRVTIRAKTAKEAAERIKNNEYRIYQIKKERKADELADAQLEAAYQEGISINWLAHYQSLGLPFVKVKLPLYEFNRREYWFNEKEKLQDVPLPKDWSFQVQWQPQPLVKAIQNISRQKWLLVGSAHFATNLRAQGLAIVLEQDNEPLANLEGIIFAKALDAPVEDEIERIIDCQKELIKTLLNLVKKLNQAQLAPKLIVLTSNAIAELEGKVNSSNSPLPGFCKTLVLELPQHKTILIDSDSPDEPFYAAKILGEISYNHGNDYEHLVAYREGKRLVARLKKAVLPEQKINLSSEGRYLITGGLGGLGLVTAQALLAVGARELILCARSVDKPEAQEAIKKMLAVYQNATIRPVSLDLTDKDKLASLLQELNRDGLLKGIIHTAGAAIKAPLLEHQEQDVDYLFSAKVKGGWYLHELSQGCQLDFFVVYSSVASAFGSNRESVYSAANSVLDLLIAKRHRLGLVGTAIQWGPWAEVGMAKERSRSQELKAALIDKELGYSFLKVLLMGQQSQITIIAPEYLKFMLAFVPKPLPMFHKLLANELEARPATSKQDLSPWLHHYLDLDSEKRFDACKTLLVTICKEILELSSSENLSEEEGFFELGFDSLMITEMASQLKKRLAPYLTITVAIGFNYPSISKLAKYIEAELNEQLAKKPVIAPVLKEEDDSVAIIGMSCTLPKAPDLAAFERLLEQGLSGIQDIPLERWDNSRYYDPYPEAPRKSYVSKLGLIDNLKEFDANFFGISPREARLMEPQQRLFLENCYKALENANYPASSLRGSLTGVYTGVGPNEYFSLLEKSESYTDELSLYSITGNALNLIPSRVAYFFDFKGPTISIDTACSSSLVALHYACQSLKNREIDYALAGGVNVLLRPESNITLCKAKALAPDGQCKTFDAKANGYVRAEGCAVIFLKRTADAIRDKDSILAVIKASAINNDGKSAGLTVPNGQSQEKVMRRALSQTDLLAQDISYIEAHGTGTALGDPIEVQAINEVYGNERAQDNPLYLGTVKTNIGHLESASGIVGLVKTVLSLQKKTIYKILNFNRLNPNIHLKATRIATEKTDWPGRGKLRAAGVNAFGFSGTNAHLILQEFPAEETQPQSPSGESYLLLLSAKSPTALENLAKGYQQYLATTADDFADICYTSAVCRDHYPCRLVLSARSAVEASHRLAGEQVVRSVEQIAKLGLQQDAALESLLINYLQGKAIDWSAYYQTCGQFKKAGLPNYCFERREFWVESKGEKAVSHEFLLQHCYQINWSPFKPELAVEKLPELLVIAQDEARVRKHFANLHYQVIKPDGQLPDLEDKNLVFLYEQGQIKALFHCCQRMFQSRPKCFVLLTENAYALVNTDRVNPYHRMASCLWQSASNELGLDNNYTVDLGSGSDLRPTLDYIFSAKAPEKQLAIRDSLYRPRLRPKQLVTSQGQTDKLFSADASYLITGGTGGLARLLIDYLIRSGVKQLVLSSRSKCPADIYALIDDAKEKGVAIRHVEADAANYRKMESLISELAQASKPLKGVFHLAGLVEDGLLINLDDVRLQRVLSAKADSALILHQLTQNLSLDHFVLFSSTASVFGARGQANYVAANGFLDGLAAMRQAQGLPAIAINWGPFKTLGMTAKLTQALQANGFIPLEKNSIDILDRLLRSGLAQITVCPMNWDLYSKHAAKQPLFAELIKVTAPATQYFLKTLQQHEREERVVFLSKALGDITADILALPDSTQIREGDDLFALGLDSLMAIEIRNRIVDTLQCSTLSLPIEYFINEPSISKIANYIADCLEPVLLKEKKDSPKVDAIKGSVALSDFQYLFWLINKIGGSFNIGMQLRLHGRVNQDFLQQAFELVVNQNNAFWLSFAEDAPCQKLNKRGQFELNYKDISLSDQDDALNQVFYNNLMSIIPLSRQPLIRVYFYKINEVLGELHLIIPHIVVDDLSCEIVFSQFKKAYESLVLGKKLAPLPANNAYVNFVKRNNLLFETNLEEKVNFWRGYNKGFRKLNFGKAYHLPGTAYQDDYLFHYSLAESQVNQFISWHHEKNINVSTGLIAACHLAFYKMTLQKKIPLILLHSGREGSEYKATVGLFSEYKRINLSLNEDENFIDFVRAIEEQLIKTAPYQKCSHFIKDSGLEGEGLSISQYLMYLANKFFLAKSFEKTPLHPTIINYYLKQLSVFKALRKTSLIKNSINKFFGLQLPLQKPEGLRVLLSITQSFFSKEPVHQCFADLEYNFPNHYACSNRPIGNRTLWVYFTRNQEGQCLLSINGPLTQDAKDQLALEVKKIIVKLARKGELSIKDLVGF